MTAHQRKLQITNGALVFCSIATAIALFAAGLALIARFNTTNTKRANQLIFNAKIANVALQDCQEIEKLKTAQRQQALATHRNLNRNLRLLHLKRTPEIVRVAQQDLNRALKNFAPDRCPRVSTRR